MVVGFVAVALCVEALVLPPPLHQHPSRIPAAPVMVDESGKGAISGKLFVTAPEGRTTSSEAEPGGGA